ncbi:Fic/DOC family protein [Pleurostoma richardsiae]|uniref:Fic/DOC family protein n=1 Tax=Pleurostoma richardsiae TaxID=41990 RepID=A0AA38RTF7_9PEZI|nr:Fic/DOC family protein [Pleurostoma richardsiae]
MCQDLRTTISRGWPPKSQRGKEQMSLTIRSDDVYRTYAVDQEPQKLFEKATEWITAVQATEFDSGNQALVAKEVEDGMIRALFGSNMIERAGLGWDITVQICRKIFAGEDVGDIPEREPYYLDNLVKIYRGQQRDLQDVPARHILRGRTEIIQHARAFQHIIHAFVVSHQDLTEELIKETHKILTHNTPIIQHGSPDVPAEQYGGAYRTVIVGAGSTNFTVPRFVPVKMKQMCQRLKEKLAAAEEKGRIDPVSVATKYSLEFVQIHPFQDGNGRMCRLILNVILCRYAGIIVPIGEHGEDRKEYIDIKVRASEEMEGHGEYATFVLGKVVERLREMREKIAGRCDKCR